MTAKHSDVQVLAEIAIKHVQMLVDTRPARPQALKTLNAMLTEMELAVKDTANQSVRETLSRLNLYMWRHLEDND